MSDDQFLDNDLRFDEFDDEFTTGDDDLTAAEEEYEEISSDEVDQVIVALESLSEQVGSENIKHYLEEASNNIYYLVYTDADADEFLEDAA